MVLYQLLIVASTCNLLAWGFSSNQLSICPCRRLEIALFNSIGPQDVAPSERSYGKGAWVPPSQNKEQKKGKVFSIQKPQDLLDFVVEDERLSVGEWK